MIAPNGNGPLQGNGPSVMASSTGQGAFCHYLDDSEALAEPEARRTPLICECHSTPSMCPECRADADEKALLSRLRRLREAEDYFVSDGEARDRTEDVT